jgi:hypothetical protein
VFRSYEKKPDFAGPPSSGKEDIKRRAEPEHIKKFSARIFCLIGEVTFCVCWLVSYQQECCCPTDGSFFL